MITANELKTRGVKALEEQVAEGRRVGITVRGKLKYIVMEVEEYDELHEAHLMMDLERAKKDIANGDSVLETAEEHLKRLWPVE